MLTGTKILYHIASILGQQEQGGGVGEMLEKTQHQFQVMCRRYEGEVLKG